MSDKKISEAVEILYKGGKMLYYHCPDCSIPLFEKDGKIFCPSCGREAIFEGDLKKEDSEAISHHSPEVMSEKIEHHTSHMSEGIPENRENDDKVGTGTKTDGTIGGAYNLESKRLHIKIEIAAERICDMISRAENAKEVRELTESLDRIIEIMKKLSR